jgi:hypothetical protein
VAAGQRNRALEAPDIIAAFTNLGASLQGRGRCPYSTPTLVLRTELALAG